MNARKTTMKSLTLTPLLAIVPIGFQACNSNKFRTEKAMDQTGDAIEADTKDAADQTTNDFKRECYKAVSSLEDQQDRLDQKIDVLKKKADRKGNKAQADTQRQLDKLEGERKDLANDIEKAKNATADAWQEVKDSFKKAGRNLDDSFDEAGE